MNIHDYLIIGSGMSSVQAAQTIIEGGNKVTMLDFGQRQENEPKSTLSKNFYSLRAEDIEQYKYFLGNNLEGIEWQSSKSLLMPDRKYIVKNVEKYLPYQASSFNLIQSLARGGLGNAWGAGASPYTKEELNAIGLPPSEMQKSYRIVSKRIGLSGCNDDADIFFDKEGLEFDEPLKFDPSISKIYNTYSKSRKKFNSKDIYFGRTPLAIISHTKDNRDAYSYRNMDFYDDAGCSVYRPWITLKKLDMSSLFTYISKAFVLEFKEKIGYTEVIYTDTEYNIKKSIKCKVLLMGAGVTSTARIILRSFKSKESLPILTNGYSTNAFLHFNSLGQSMNKNNNSLGQLEVFYKHKNDPLKTSMASLYTYSSIMLSSLLKETPYLGFSYSRKLMAYIQSSLVIASYNHPDKYNKNNFLKLVNCNNSLTGDKIKINYSRGELLLDDKNAEKIFTKALLKTGCFPLSANKMKPGSAVHYSGTLPFNSSLNKFYLNTDGKLNCSKNVYVIDGSGFKFLPANGISFSLMANADRISRKLINRVQLK